MIFSQATTLPAIAGERYRMATRMGGARIGKKIGERLMDAELRKEEVVKHLLNFLEHCNVGTVKLANTLVIGENCEAVQIKSYTTKMKEPSCFFTTGFLNGFFVSVTNQHVREIKCIAAGDPYCEWDFR
jgi:predicted hydrocarbon binding protein